LLVKKGFDPDLGARPLKRVIQQEILDPLALMIVSGEIKEGDRIIVSAKENKVTFKGPKELMKTSKKEKVLVK